MAKNRALPTREEMDPKDCWRLEDLYADDQQWESDSKELKKEIENVT